MRRVSDRGNPGGYSRTSYTHPVREGPSGGAVSVFAGHLIPPREPCSLQRRLPGPPTRLNDRNLLRVVDVAEAVRKAPATAADAIGYMARILIQTNLPHGDPGDVPAWTRRNGKFVLQITPGATVGVVPARQLGIPFGIYPRLILAYVTTEALRPRSPLIRLGRNLSETMERVGPLRCTGGQRGTITRFKEQLMRLSRAEIAWAFREGDKVLSAGSSPSRGWRRSEPSRTSARSSRNSC